MGGNEGDDSIIANRTPETSWAERSRVFRQALFRFGGCCRPTPGSDIARTRFTQGLSPTRTHRPIFGLMRPPSVRARQLSSRFNRPLLPYSRKPSPRRSREEVGRAVSLCARRHDGRARHRGYVRDGMMAKRGVAAFEAKPPLLGLHHSTSFVQLRCVRPASQCSSSFAMKPSSPNPSSCGNEQRAREPQESRWPQCRQQGHNRSHRSRG